MKFFFLILLALVGCTKKAPPEPKFKAGDCVDRSAWVVKSGELQGNRYLMVVDQSADEFYFLVKECVIKKNKATCTWQEPLGPWEVSTYAKISCPKVKVKQ